MKHKKLTAIVLTTAFAMGITAPVFADTPAITVLPAEKPAETEVVQQSLLTTVGTVEEVNDTEDYKSILVKNDQTEVEFYINMDRESGNATWLLDENGFPIALKDLTGKEVVVSHSPAMTMSIPGKSNAKAVMVKGDVAPNYAVIEAVSKNADGSVTVTTDNGSRKVTINKDAKISPYLNKMMVYIDGLKAGDEVVLYYDIMALSYPAQAHTDRVLLLKSAPFVTADDENAGKPLDEMVGLREAAAELGMEIHWNAEGNTVILNKGAFSATITIGSKNYGINKMLVKQNQAAEIRDGRTFVPQSFVDEIKEALQ